MNKSFLNIKYILIAVFALAVSSVLLSSCVKTPGHIIGTPVVIVKSGLVNFSVRDTAHTLLTSADTVTFTTATSPSALTTINATNMSTKYLAFKLTVAALTTGTYTIKTFQITYVDGSGALITTSNTNTGTVTITTYNSAGGLIIGTFSTVVQNTSSATNTVPVTGSFNIQQ